MRIKLLTTLALLLMAVSGAWAQDKGFWLDNISGMSAATLKYGDWQPGYPYFDGTWHPNSYFNDDQFKAFKEVTCQTITVDASCQNFEGTSLANLFEGWSGLTTINNLGNLKTSEITNMSNMFKGCSALTTLDLSGWNTSEVTNMSNMFNGCTALTTLDLTGWGTYGVENMGSMFNGCMNLKNIYVGDFWSTTTVTNSEDMFYGCTNLPNWKSTNPTDKTYANTGAGGYLSEKFLYLVISSDGKSATMYCGVVPENTPYYTSDWESNGYSEDFDYFKESACTEITVDATTCKNFNGDTLESLFDGWENLTTINGLGNLNTSKVEDMEHMFDGCGDLKTLDLSSWDTSKVTNMEKMFEGCSSLTTLDLSGWDTSNVEDMESMFERCGSLTTLDLSGWDTSNVEDMSEMFCDCKHLTTIYVGDNWKTTNVTSSNSMFEDCDHLPNWDDTDNGTHANTGTDGYLTTKVTTDVTGNSDGAGNYWATYYDSSKKLWADANTTVYQAAVNGAKTAVVLTEVTNKEIPAGAGVILKSSASTIKLAELSSTATPQALTGNQLLGTDVDLATPANAYCLSMSGSTVGFYTYTSTDGPNGDGVIPAHRAYLVIPTSARSFYGFGNDNYTTDIELPEAVAIEGDGPIYDLSGRRVTGQPKKGIYVKNGKLFVIK